MKAEILIGDCLERMRELPPGIAQTCITSPPYFGLRDYGVDGQIGLEPTPEEFVAKLVEVFREVRRVLRDDGTLWLNLGDSYNSGPSGGLGGSTLQGSQESQVGRRKAFRPGAGRADGNVDDRAQRNRNGTFAPGLKTKDLIGIPWRVAFALQSDGWYLRSDIIWHKPNPMPESVTDRPTKSHEYLFLLAKSDRYYFDSEAFKEPQTKGAAGSEFHTGKTGEHQLGRASTKPRKSGNKERSYGGDPGKRPDDHLGSGVPWEDVDGLRNRRTVWTIPTHPFKGAHFATFPPALVEPCVLAGCPIDGTVLDPFNGAGTTGLVALRNQRNYIGCELNPEYAAMARDRLLDDAPLLHQVEIERLHG